MIKKVRQKVATSVSKIEFSDYFEFSRWLRVPSIEGRDVELPPIESPPDKVDVESFEVPVSKKYKVKILEKKLLSVKDSTIVKPARVVLVFFAIPKPNYYSFKNELFVPNEKITQHNFLEKINISTHAQNFVFSDGLKETQNHSFSISEQISEAHHFIFYQSVTFGYDLLVTLPQIEDKLAALIPKVYNIELLNDQMLTTENVYDLSEHIQDISQLPSPKITRHKIPGIDDLTTKVISYKPERITAARISEIKMDAAPRVVISKSPKVDFKKPVIRILKSSAFQTDIPEIQNPFDGSDVSAQDKRIIRHMLSGSVIATWEKTRKVIQNLLPHQEEGAKFLAENNFAVLAEEPGTGKQLQLVGALKFLFKTSQIKSALLITKNTRIGNKEHFKKFRVQEGFIVRLIEYAPELRYNIITNPEEGLPEENRPITIISYNNLEDLPALFELTSRNLSFEALIIDEFSDSITSNMDVENLFRRFYPDFFWLLTGKIKIDSYKKYFEASYLPEGKNWSFLVRSIEELSAKLANVRYENVWFEPSESQNNDYRETLESNSDELKRAIESINPFRFQSTVFTLIHRLKQTGNFSVNDFDSPKSKFLVDQLKITVANNRRTIIFTQYDNLGLKKIEKILEKEKIKHLSVQNGASLDDVKNGLNLFYSNDNYPVFVTNMKPSRIKTDLKKISYIVNFDQWWNPASQWQLEEEIGLENYKGKQIVFYNYLMANSFDESILNLIEEKDLMNRELFSELSTESLSELFEQSDWLRIFEIYDKAEDKTEKINQIKVRLTRLLKDDFNELIKKLFLRLGYRDLDEIDIYDEPSFYLIGRSGKPRSVSEIRAKCIIGKKINQSDWEEVLEQETNKANIQKLFVITNGKFEANDQEFSRTINFIDIDRLANLIVLLSLMPDEEKKPSK